MVLSGLFFFVCAGHSYSQRCDDHDRLAISYQAQVGVALQPGEVESEKLLPLLSDQQRQLCQSSVATPDFKEKFQEHWNLLDSVVSLSCLDSLHCLCKCHSYSKYPLT